MYKLKSECSVLRQKNHRMDELSFDSVRCDDSKRVQEKVPTKTMASTIHDTGRDEATEGMQDLCAYCVDKGKHQPATKFCFDCGPFGRYICGMCMQNHDYFTSGHNVKHLSEAVRHENRIESDRLTENNPVIADLIGERFSELYSNQWSDAYEELTTSAEKLNEKDAIKVLLNIFEAIYSVCHQEATIAVDRLKTTLLQFTGHSKLSRKLESSLTLCKDERKQNFKKTIPDVAEVARVFVPNVRLKENSAVSSYVQEATEICWLICIQKPPLDIITRCMKGTKFDYQLFDAYTVIGQTFAFTLWPALLLHKQGPVLRKGVAQGIKKSDSALRDGAWPLDA